VRLRIVAALLAVLAALAFAACQSDGSKSSTGSSSTTTARSTTTSTARPTCALGTGYSVGTTTHTLPVAGVERDLLVHVPFKPVANMPLVVDFHGAGSNMAQQAVYSGFDAVADTNGFVVATPNGADAPIRQWNFLGQDDVAFAKAIIDELVANACVDTKRAYAVGISSGSAMSASLACQASDRFAGFGLVAGDFYNATFCGNAERRPIVIFHGTSDAVVPYAGGRVATGGMPVQGAEAVAEAWAQHNGCTAGPKETQLGTEVVRLDWTGCKEPVVMYRIVGGGHTWPGAAIDVARLGATTHQVSATDEMWKLFSQNG
jgi:polyhydroxybutyrate depolymerase